MLKKSIIIYGFHTVKEAIESSLVKIIIFFIVKNKIKKYNFLINKAIKKKIPFKILPNLEAIKVVNSKNIKSTQGIVAYVNLIKDYTIQDIINKKKTIILILYNITDTKNIGSIIRTAACFGVDFIIIPKTYYIYNTEIIKISSGAIFKIKICRVKNILFSINFLIKNNVKILSITEKGNIDISKNNFSNKKESIALILGSEETGIPQNILDISNYKLFIPIKKNIISSLNVSIACGIILYELNKNL